MSLPDEILHAVRE